DMAAGIPAPDNSRSEHRPVPVSTTSELAGIVVLRTRTTDPRNRHGQGPIGGYNRAMKKVFQRLETKLIHAGEPEPRIEGAVSMPIFQSANFEYGNEQDYH